MHCWRFTVTVFANIIRLLGQSLVFIFYPYYSMYIFGVRKRSTIFVSEWPVNNYVPCMYTVPLQALQIV